MTYRMASYELYALAVIAFVIDHAGGIFFPDNLWLRVLRLFALIWFFPIGYNSAWRSKMGVWYGLAIITLLDAVLYNDPFPLSALATLLVARPLVDPLMNFAMKSPRRFWGVQCMLALLALPTAQYVEYGTMSLIIAIAGWLVRHRGRIPGDIVSLPHYFVYMVALYLAFSQHSFHFNPPQLAFVTVSTGLTALLVYHFDGLIREDLRRRRMPAGRVRRAARFIGHKTLEIYVLHLALFKLMLLAANL
jgi:hypothetical protein